MNFKGFLVFFLLSLMIVYGLALLSCEDEDDGEGNEDNPAGEDDDLTETDDDSEMPEDDDMTDDDSEIPEDDDDATDDDDVTDDDDSAVPEIVDRENTDCKNGAGPETKGDFWPESIEFSYESGVLTVTHINGEFNCCIEYIDVTLQIEGFTLDLLEQEVAPNPCFCICPYDVTTQIAGLASGTYTVNIYVNGTFSISGQTTIP